MNGPVDVLAVFARAEGQARIFAGLAGDPRAQQLLKDLADARVAVAEQIAAHEALLAYVERNICAHEETHRGGAIWEICDGCGAKWADDEGGKPEPIANPRVHESIRALARVKGDAA